MDVIALHSVGITNSVATLGTAITSEQARLISRYTKRVVISYDADEAGQKAARRAIDLLDEVGVEVSILSIPGAKDPDEYIKTYGVDKFKSVISGAKSKFDYNFDSILSKYDISLEQDKINALNEIEILVSKVYSAAERDIYINKISERFGVSVVSLKSDIERILRKNKNAYRKSENEKNIQNAIGYSDRINPDFVKAPAVARNEENVLGLLLIYPEYRKKCFGENLLSQDDFFTDLNKRIYLYLENSFFNCDDKQVDLSEVFTPEERGRINKMRLARMELSNNESVLIDSINSLKRSIEKENLNKTNTLESLNDFLSKKRND